jgi:glycosyltransferase involved in cell wall biosynthesis
MKIAFISAGAAGMYCGSCLQDNTLAAALKGLGHDVTLIPTYTPMKTDDRDVSTGRIFYGAINIYLQQKAALFRHLPRAVDRLLNRPGLLDLAVRLGASTDPRDLGPLTLSVLLGEDGRQIRELEILIDWLRERDRPDVVHLTNSMFLGLAPNLKEALGATVLCSLQGEDLFVEGLNPPWRDRVLQALRERARGADGFIAPCRAYARFMSDWLEVPEEKMRVVPLGLNLDGHEQAEPAATPFVVGYLARIAPEKGLHLLAEAFRDLAERVGRDNVRLRVAGYLGPRDRAYLDGIRSRLREWGLADRCEFAGEVDRPGKLRFLQGLHVLSVPTVYRDPKGRFLLEALASGVPVVQPRHGAFPEMIEETGGGLLVEPGSPKSLADGLHALLSDPERRRELGRRGRDAVYNGRSDRAMAEATLEVYRAFAGSARGEQRAP